MTEEIRPVQVARVIQRNGAYLIVWDGPAQIKLGGEKVGVDCAGAFGLAQKMIRAHADSLGYLTPTKWTFDPTTQTHTYWAFWAYTREESDAGEQV